MSDITEAYADPAALTIRDTFRHRRITNMWQSFMNTTLALALPIHFNVHTHVGIGMFVVLLVVVVVLRKL